MKRIALEEAFVTPEIIEAWTKVVNDGAKGEPGFLKMAETILSNTPSTELLHQRLIDLGEQRIQDMDEAGIDVQVISLTSPGVQVFDPDTGTGLAKQANDRLSEAVLAHPERFVGLAAVAPQNPTEAAKERHERARLAHGDLFHLPAFLPNENQVLSLLGAHGDQHPSRIRQLLHERGRHGGGRG